VGSWEHGEKNEREIWGAFLSYERGKKKKSIVYILF